MATCEIIKEKISVGDTKEVKKIVIELTEGEADELCKFLTNKNNLFDYRNIYKLADQIGKQINKSYAVWNHWDFNKLYKVCK